MASKSEWIGRDLRFSSEAKRALCVSESHAKQMGKSLKRLITPKALAEGIFSINTRAHKFATTRSEATRELARLGRTPDARLQTRNLRRILKLITPENER